MTIKIGFTERGDGGRDLSWVQKCKERKVNGAVIITKTLTDECINAVLNLHKTGFPIILHATCTGWGSTIIEPGAYPYGYQLNQIRKLTDAGFPMDHIVLRIDPIWPTPPGLARVNEVLDEAIARNILPTARCRISVLDEYKHVKKRIEDLGFKPCYGPNRFYATKEEFDLVKENLSKYDIKFYTCAEPMLGNNDRFIQAGCLSELDLQLMGLPLDTDQENNQNRSGCHCLSGKTELLTARHRCPSQCIYCYWKD